MNAAIAMATVPLHTTHVVLLADSFNFIVALDNGPSYYCAEASELAMPPGKWPMGFMMGGKHWVLRNIHRDREGDVTHIDYWESEHGPMNNPKTIVRIYND